MSNSLPNRAGHGGSTERPRKVAILGQGYVGLPVAMRSVEVGYDVVGFDLDEARVKALADGESFVTDVTSEEVADALATGRYRATSDESELSGFDVAVIDVPTPLREGVPDLSHVEQATRMLGRHLRVGSVVILESTTYPGTTEELVATDPRIPVRTALPAPTSISATARSGSIRGTRPGPSSIRRRSSQG